MWWASTEQVMGTLCPHCGHRVPILWDDFWALFWVSEFVFFSICSWLQFCVFVQCFMVIWWYFYRNYDTSMMLLCKHIWKCHFANRYVSVIYLQTMILWDFFQEKTFMCEDKGMGESASFVSGYSHHFPEKYRKLEKNSRKLASLISFSYFMHP